MRRSRPSAAMLGGILAASMSLPEVAHADGMSTATCNWTGRAAFSPGLTLAPRRGTLQFQGQSGSIECRGTVGGAEVTGPGALGLHGEYGRGPVSAAFGGGACHEGGARFTFTITIPTKRGSVEFSTIAEAEHIGPIGEYQGRSFSGIVRFSPAKGDCLTGPATELVMNGQGILHT